MPFRPWVFCGATAGDPDLWGFCGGAPVGARTIYNDQRYHTPEPPPSSIAPGLHHLSRPGQRPAPGAPSASATTRPRLPCSTSPTASLPARPGLECGPAASRVARRRGAGGVRRDDLVDSDDRDRTQVNETRTETMSGLAAIRSAYGAPREPPESRPDADAGCLPGVALLGRRAFFGAEQRLGCLDHILSELPLGGEQLLGEVVGTGHDLLGLG